MELPVELEEWKPLVDGRKFDSTLINISKEAKPKTKKEMIQIELLFKEEEDDELGGVEDDVILNEVLLRYDNAVHYHDIFLPLITKEANCDKKLKESQSQDNIEVRWGVGVNKKIIAYFKTGNMKLMLGDELRLGYFGDMQEPWSGVGHVIKVPDHLGDEVRVELTTNSGVLTSCTNNIKIDFVWKSTRYVYNESFICLRPFFSFDRMLTALRKFSVLDRIPYNSIYNILLGHDDDNVVGTLVSEEISAPNLPDLNSSQVNAVRHALQCKVSLIQGPPGTGKTVTSATIVFQQVKHRGRPVLVCAPTNIAADNICDQINKTGVEVVRLYSKKREAQETKISHLALHNKILKNIELRNLTSMKDNGTLSKGDEKR